MSKLSWKISVPIFLAGIFAVVIFIAIEPESIGTPFYVIVSLLALFLFFFGFYSGQEFADPVKKMLERATELSNGNFSTRVYLETKDELSQLAAVINKIAEELESSSKKQEGAENEINIKVKARTQQLEETISALEQKVKNRTVELERLIKESDKFKRSSQDSEAQVAELKKQMETLKQKPKRKKTTTET